MISLSTNSFAFARWGGAFFKDSQDEVEQAERKRKEKMTKKRIRCDLFTFDPISV